MKMIFLTMSVLGLMASLVRADVRTWTGLAGDGLAGTPANWSEGIAPSVGDSVRFDGTSGSNCTWNLDVALGGWDQQVTYTGRVTFLTRYPGQGSFTNLVINGNAVVQGGTWTHPANTGTNTAADRLAVRVGGDFRLGAAAKVNLNGRGYAINSGPGAGVAAARNGRAGSHGGMGAHAAGYLPASCYGEPTAPEHLGSGGSYSGGGAFKLEASGQALIDGVISADGVNLSPSDAEVRSGAAGGSIWIRAGSVSGTGALSARGSYGYFSGAGGRIALEATNAISIEGPTATVDAGEKQITRSTAGTLFLRSLAYQRLIVDGSNQVAQADIATELPPASNTYAIQPAVGGPLENATFFMTNRAVVRLTSSVRLADFAWMTATSSLDLNGFTLYLKADAPAGAFPQDYGRGTIVTNGGRILWGDASVEFTVTAESGPNGSVTRTPEHANDLYDMGSTVTLTAFPDANHAFLWWTGELPAGAVRTNNPLVVTVDKRYEVRALFADNRAGMKTWVGEGGDEKASTAANWYPAGAPAAGHHVIFNDTSTRSCTWDADATLGSWTQTDGYRASWDPALGYRGWVSFATKYPLFGSFTNLAITGNCILEAGTWTHPWNTGDTTEANRIWVTVGGNFTLGTNALIDLSNFGGQSSSRGYAPARGPGAGNGSPRNPNFGRGASHGGRGAVGISNAASACYGSIREPVHLGSGANTYGGGAVRLEVGGLAQIAGTIDARGGRGSGPEPGPAGGSVWLTAGSMSGSGLLTANGAQGYFSGGGGRIAVDVTNATGFGSVRMQAYAGSWGDSNRRGAAGTIFRKSLEEPGFLLIDNNDMVQAGGLTETWYTEFPAAIGGDGPERLRTLFVSLARRARVGISRPDLSIGNLTVDSTSVLYLNGYNLYVRSQYPKGGLGGTVVAEGGRIVWLTAGTLLFIR